MFLFVLPSLEWDQEGGPPYGGRNLGTRGVASQWGHRACSRWGARRKPLGVLPSAALPAWRRWGHSHLCIPHLHLPLQGSAEDWPTSLTPTPQCPGPQFQAFPGQVSAGSPGLSHLFSPSVGKGGPENSGGRHTKSPPSHYLLHQPRGFLRLHSWIYTCYYLFLETWWFLIRWQSNLQMIRKALLDNIIMLCLKCDCASF